MSFVLDTHALLWWFQESERLPQDWRRRISDITTEEPALLCDITLWEIATLVSLQRLRLNKPLGLWLESVVRSPRLESVRFGPAIAAEVAALPDSFHRDPADRIIVATARVRGLPVMTLDRRIIDARIVDVI